MTLSWLPLLAWQITEAMRKRNLSRKRLAERMKTSRSQVSRLLDPTDGNVTLTTLQRAATVVGRKLRLELVQPRQGWPYVVGRPPRRPWRGWPLRWLP